MAIHNRRPENPNVRERLATRYRSMAESHPSRVMARTYTERAERLETEQEYVCSEWELAALRTVPGVSAGGSRHFRVELDGTIT